MTLIAILLALACERLLSHLQRWRRYDWFGRYLSRLQEISLIESCWESSWGLLFLTPPLLLIGWLQSWLHGGVFGLVFSALVLVFALGPRDLWEEVHRLIDARGNGRRDDAASIAADLTAIAGTPPTTEPSTSALVRAVVLQAHERVFGVLMWFFVLGPLGAAGYRLIAEYPRQLRTQRAGSALTEAAARLHAVAARVPLRLTALVYGLAGSTDGALAGRRRAEAAGDEWAAHGWRLLAETGCGALRMEEGRDHHHVALGPDEALRQALALARRSLIILLAVFAAFTMGGWLA